MAADETLDTRCRPMRADARRNYRRLLEAAQAAFDEHGVDASLDQIAKDACVGPGTLYRHFPTRRALLAAVFNDQVDAIARLAEELLDADDPGEAVATWLAAVLEHGRRHRGLAATLMLSPDEMAACHGKMRQAAAGLLDRAQQAGAFREEIAISDLLKLVHGISLVAERVPADPELGERLLDLALDGLRR